MKKSSLLVLSVVFLFASQASALPIPGVWNLENGIAAVLDPEGDGGNIGDEAAGRDTYILSEPGNAYYWSFDGLIRTRNIAGAFVDNGDGTATRSLEVFRTGGTFTIHGDHLWGQAPGTIYEVSIESHFVGENHYALINGAWQWMETVGSSHVTGAFTVEPFLFELTDTINLNYWGYNNVVGHDVIMGEMTHVVMTVSPVPEPATIILLGAGLLGIAGASRRKFKK